MSKEILLTQGKSTTVDDDQLEDLGKYKWYAFKCRGRFYAARKVVINGKQRTILMHRQLICCNDNNVIDHIDGNSLNNQKSNLRPCNNSQNLCNRGKNINNISGFKGVSWHCIANKWVAQIKVNRKKIYIGLFNCAIKAASAYDKFATQYHGAYAQLNFMTEAKIKSGMKGN